MSPVLGGMFRQKDGLTHEQGCSALPTPRTDGVLAFVCKGCDHHQVFNRFCLECGKLHEPVCSCGAVTRSLLGDEASLYA